MNRYTQARRDALEAADKRDRESVSYARRQMQVEDRYRPETSEVAASFEHMCNVLEGRVHGR